MSGRENILSQNHVMSFDWDSANIESKKNFANTLKSLIGAGAELILFKDFYNETFDKKEKREIALELIIQKADTADIVGFLRTPVKMKQLVQFCNHGLDMYTLYIASDIKTVNKDTVFYLDDAVEVDDEDNEFYPPFAPENNLTTYFHGNIAADIIENTRYQLEHKNPSVSDYIKNFNYYSTHDCYFDFE